jgi:Spy/CpxP family protein refolding chaperone
MFDFEGFTRVATAAVGALVLSTLTVAAAVGPARVAETASPVYAQAHVTGHNGTVAHG